MCVCICTALRCDRNGWTPPNQTETLQRIQTFKPQTKENQLLPIDHALRRRLNQTKGASVHIKRSTESQESSEREIKKKKTEAKRYTHGSGTIVFSQLIAQNLMSNAKMVSWVMCCIVSHLYFSFSVFPHILSSCARWNATMILLLGLFVSLISFCLPFVSDSLSLFNILSIGRLYCVLCAAATDAQCLFASRTWEQKEIHFVLSVCPTMR